jgi:hypothetical protein
MRVMDSSMTLLSANIQFLVRSLPSVVCSYALVCPPKIVSNARVRLALGPCAHVLQQGCSYNPPPTQKLLPEDQQLT